MFKLEDSPVPISELEMDLFDDYPLEVLVSQWNPSLAQVQLRKRHRQEEAERLMEYPPDPF